MPHFWKSHAIAQIRVVFVTSMPFCDFYGALNGIFHHILFAIFFETNEIFITYKRHFFMFVELGCTCTNKELTVPLYDFLVTVKAAPHECVIRTGQPKT